VERSSGKVRADIVHDRHIVPMGFTGDERTTRRAVAETKEAFLAGRRRTSRPWIPEPGMWLQFDWADGPVIRGRKTCLFCVWLAWSRFRVVIPTWDRTLETLLACLDGMLRRIGAAPTYALMDNERAITTGFVAGIPQRHAEIVAAAGTTGWWSRPAGPTTPKPKGGSEATVRVAKADLVPTDATSATRSTPGRTPPPGGPRPSCWSRSVAISIRCRTSPTRPPLARRAWSATTRPSVGAAFPTRRPRPMSAGKCGAGAWRRARDRGPHPQGPG
jgi:hypothetical protein